MLVKHYKLTGINTWFIIEILSFYGYILSAVAFIVENSIKSSLGWIDKSHMMERYKSDFINYHRKDLDWLAFVTILLNVNIIQRRPYQYFGVGRRALKPFCVQTFSKTKSLSMP